MRYGLVRFLLVLVATSFVGGVNAGSGLDPKALHLASNSAIVVDAGSGKSLYSKNADATQSIASITKLMTAMVVLDAKQPMSQKLKVTQDDVDTLKHTSSRIKLGAVITRKEMLRLALMSSENRAASALARNYPGGRSAFVKAMNAKAKALGMKNTRFRDSTGLSPENVSTASDLVKMVKAASEYDLISEYTTTAGRHYRVGKTKRTLEYKNTNAIVREGEWDVAVSKTGYTKEAGRCLVMMATVADRPVVMVFLESEGKLTPVGDANRVRQWMEGGKTRTAATASRRSQASI